MTRLWNWEKKVQNGQKSDSTSQPSNGSRSAVLEPAPVLSPYVTRPIRPTLQYAARIGLWSAVGLGCLGGAVALVRPSNAGAVETPATTTTEDESMVPGPVAGMAETVVEAWLTATDDDQERLDALFVDSPSVDAAATEGLQVGAVRTVAGRRMADGYWSATVAAAVTEDVSGGEDPIDGEGDDTDATEGEEAGPRETTWYVQVGIVGDVRHGLAALAAPAVMPAPPEVTSPWEVVDDASSLPQEQEDAVVTTIEGFLGALLAGDGDPQRYAAPGLDLRAPDPAPFQAVSVEDIAVTEVPDQNGRIWAQAHVLAITPGGAEQVFTYDLTLDPRVDRWEVVSLSGAPTFVDRSEPTSEDQP